VSDGIKTSAGVMFGRERDPAEEPGQLVHGMALGLTQGEGGRYVSLRFALTGDVSEAALAATPHYMLSNAGAAHLVGSVMRIFSDLGILDQLLNGAYESFNAIDQVIRTPEGE